MNSVDARKYLNGEITLDEVSQAPSDDQGVPPVDQAPAGGAGSEEGAEDKGKQPETQDEKPSEQPPEQLDSPNPEDKPSEDKTATSSEEGKPDDSKNTQPKPKSDKPEKLPYPKANPNDVEKIKANKAFIKQKQKYQTKIHGLEAQVENLKAQLLKFNAVDPKTLGDDPDKQMDFRVAKGMLKNRISDLEMQRQNAILEQESAEAEQIHQQRVDACFDDESSKAHYLRLLENGRDKFVAFLGQHDPENTILSYLDDSEISPLMVQVLMTNPEVLKKVVSIKNPMNKIVELRSIENRVKLDQKLRSVKTPRPQQTNKNPAGKLPSTGSQTKAGAGKDPNPVRDRNYWQNYLATHS